VSGLSAAEERGTLTFDSHQEDWQANEENPLPVAGTVLRHTPYVEIRWPWLSYLVLELWFSAVFFAGVMIATKNSNVPILKSSSLAALCAIDDDARKCLGDIGDFEELKHRTDKIRLRLAEILPESGGGMFLRIEKE